jgi:hypothetical protein
VTPRRPGECFLSFAGVTFNMEGAMDPEKKHLQDVASRVHQALRKLKLGQGSTIACDKEIKSDEVRQYLLAYAYHKQKWFNVRHDAVADILYVERVPVPPLRGPEEDDDPDEP